MIDKATLRVIAAARLEDAEILLVNQRYDGAVYVCGYAVELALKARICDTLNWPNFPETSGEFQGLQSFKVHNLAVLLLLSGRKESLKSDPTFLANWSTVEKWNPEARYQNVGVVSPVDARNFLRSAKTLLSLL